MATSHSLSGSAVSAVAEKIVQARKLYGADSAYVIGLFAGIDLVLAGDEGENPRRQLRDRVLELESGKTAQRTATEPARKGGGGGGGGGEGVALAENTWIRGAVKWFNNDKGYGFISTDSETDVFVHWRDISSWDRSLTQGDEVEFMVTKTAKGFQAINVMKADKEGAGGGRRRDGAAPSGETGSGGEADPSAGAETAVEGVAAGAEAPGVDPAAAPAPQEGAPAAGGVEAASENPTPE